MTENDHNEDNAPEIMDKVDAPVEITLAEQLDEMKDQWLRAVAESENVRKRAQRDKEENAKYGAVSLARDVVSIADNLRRAMQACEHEDRATLPTSMVSLLDGLNMIVAEIDSTFAKHHVKRLYPVNEPFNAHYHQAMFEIESADHAVGTVLQVMQDGYTLHDRLLRPAFVGVSKAVVTQE
jgi:molecular chaperone GrpE